ncbi:MAG: KamA family radical SAM protein [Alphaproteobacteria bacterium]|nr:KamA family radical SAM protein [Alphaproteobacteria bacterium]
MNSAEFRKKYFPNVLDEDWNDWKWQMRNRVTSYDQLSKIFDLTDSEKQALTMDNAFPVAITPYYLSVAIDCSSVRRTILPNPQEHNIYPGETNDPLGEEPAMKVPGLVHRYPDRVLFLTTEYCSTYCRYCTRSRLVGRNSVKPSTCMSKKQRWEEAFKYIRDHKEIRDVLVSGGDPLTMDDESIDYLLSNLRKIEHVEMIRIGSKTPVVLPQRFTPNLLNIIKKYHPVYFSLHFTHPSELTPETNKACNMIADAGIIMGSQTVLLRNVNDDAKTLKQLMHKLLLVRCRPYYLFQCDPIEGSAHFRVKVEDGLKIIDELRGYTSGYAIPTYAIDIPGGGGKIVLTPNHVIGKDGDFLKLRNFEGKEYLYPDYITEV